MKGVGGLLSEESIRGCKMQEIRGLLDGEVEGLPDEMSGRRCWIKGMGGSW